MKARISSCSIKEVQIIGRYAGLYMEYEYGAMHAPAQLIKHPNIHLLWTYYTIEYYFMFSVDDAGTKKKKIKRKLNHSFDSLIKTQY